MLYIGGMVFKFFIGMFLNFYKQRGFTLIEVTIVLAIFSLLIVLAVISALSFRSQTDLNSLTQNILSTLRLAQSRTTASQEASSWGVHFENDRYVLFKGGVYNPSNTSNEIYILSSNIEISSWNIGGGNEVIFNRITGATSNNGLVTLRVKNNPAQSRTIYIDSSGEIGLGTGPIISGGGRVTDTRHVHYNLGWNIQGSTTLTIRFTWSPNQSVTYNIPMASYFNQSNTELSWEDTLDAGGESQHLKIHTHQMTPTTQLCIHRDREENSRAVDISIDGRLITSYDTQGNITVGAFGGSAEVQ